MNPYVAGLSAVIVCAASPCSGVASQTSSDGGTTEAGSGSGGGGGSCATLPGQVPPPACDDTPEDCVAPAPACPTVPCNASSPCLAIADNTGQAVQDLRIRKLNFTAPPVFTQNPPLFFDSEINLNLLCGENGSGTFSWLLRFDATQQTLETGGSPPIGNPFAVPYCFLQGSFDGFPVAPVTATLSQQPDGTLAAAAIAKLYVPVYYEGNAIVPLILPISNARFQGMTLSSGGNCIGAYNPDAVTPPSPNGLCDDQDPSSCQRWHTAGSVSGFITLKDADAVPVPGSGFTLCVMLTNQPAGHCATDAAGDIVVKGDFCSQTNAPGGCADSLWIAATFAASAAQITDSSTDPRCGG